MELFPRKIDELISDFHTKNDYLKANTDRFNISELDTIEMDTVVGEVDEAHARTLDKATCTKIDTLMQKEALEKAKILFRRVIEYRVKKNPNLTEMDYTILRLPHQGGGQPLPSPSMEPGIRNLRSFLLRIEGEYFDVLTGKKGRAVNCRELEIYYKIGGDEPETITELKERLIVTNNPIVIQFSEEGAYHFVYLAFRWIGTRGEYGPWTTIFKVMIIR
jgi:hypothetical protein